jgi:hypothetical protein
LWSLETPAGGGASGGGGGGGGGGGQSTRGSGRKEVGVASASLQGIFGGLFKGADTGEAARQQYTATVAQVNALEVETQMLSDEDLRASTVELKKRARSGESMDSILPVSSPLIILFLSPPNTPCCTQNSTRVAVLEEEQLMLTIFEILLIWNWDC